MNFHSKSAQKYACERRTVLPYGEKKCYFQRSQCVHSVSAENITQKYRYVKIRYIECQSVSFVAITFFLTTLETKSL